MIKSYLLQACVFALLLTISALAALGQSPNTASMNVTVVDQNGAVVRGANVSVVNTATGATREAVSGEEYDIPHRRRNPGTQKAMMTPKFLSVTSFIACVLHRAADPESGFSP